MFRRPQKLLLLVIGLALFAAACGGGTSDPGGESASANDAPAAEAPAGESDFGVPDFEAEFVSGGTFASAELFGEPTVYWFWASW